MVLSTLTSRNEIEVSDSVTDSTERNDDDDDDGMNGKVFSGSLARNLDED